MRPILVHTVPSADCSESKGGCKDCSLILDGLIAGSSLVKISGEYLTHHLQLVVKPLTGGGFVQVFLEKFAHYMI